MVYWQKGKTSQFQVKYTDYPASMMPSVKEKGFSSALIHARPPGWVPVSTASLRSDHSKTRPHRQSGRDHSAWKSLAVLDCGLPHILLLKFPAVTVGKKGRGQSGMKSLSTAFLTRMT